MNTINGGYMNGEMYSCFGNYGYFGMLIHLVLFILFIFFIYFIIKKISNKSNYTLPITILEERFAKGEIDKKEFDEKKKILK